MILPLPKADKCLVLYFFILDSYSKWIRQKCYQFFIKKKLKQTFCFPTCILPNYVPHEITKEFWKNSHFENMRAGFLLRCLNWLRWNTPEKMHFQEWHFLFSPIFPLWHLMSLLNVVCVVPRWCFDYFLWP